MRLHTNCSIYVLLLRKIEQNECAYRHFTIKKKERKKHQIGKCTILPDNEYGNGPLASQIC